VRLLIAALLVPLIVALVTGCGGGASYPPTRGYSTEQVMRIFKAHGLALGHVPPLEKQSGVGTHLRAALRSAKPGYVAVFIYRSSREARLAARSFPKQYSVKLRRMYRSVLVVNVLAVVFVVDRAGSRVLKKTQAAMADLRRI
jgi:hypothetical protein